MKKPEDTHSIKLQRCLDNSARKLTEKITFHQLFPQTKPFAFHPIAMATYNPPPLANVSDTHSDQCLRFLQQTGFIPEIK